VADDIVNDLQAISQFVGAAGPKLREAADEIERLRVAGDALHAAVRNHDLTEAHLRAWEEARRG